MKNNKAPLLVAIAAMALLCGGVLIEVVKGPATLSALLVMLGLLCGLFLTVSLWRRSTQWTGHW